MTTLVYYNNDETNKLSPILHLRSNILDYLPTILDRCDIIIAGCHTNANEIFSIHNRWGQAHSPIFLNFSVKLLVYIIVDLHITHISKITMFAPS